MSLLAHRLLWTGLCLALLSNIALDLHPLTAERSRISSFPARGLGYGSAEIPLSRGELSLYNRAEVIKRCYRVGRDRFMFIAIDGTRNRHAVHDPIYCFQGAGWTVDGREAVPVEAGYANLLHLKKGAEGREVLYWFSDGRSRHASILRYWLQASVRRMSLGRSGKEPVLIMLQSIGGDQINFMEVINKFGPLFEV